MQNKKKPQETTTTEVLQTLQVALLKEQLNGESQRCTEDGCVCGYHRFHTCSCFHSNSN